MKANPKLKYQEYELKKKQTIETLTNEEALLLAKFIRNERNEWIPRIA